VARARARDLVLPGSHRIRHRQCQIIKRNDAKQSYLKRPRLVPGGRPGAGPGGATKFYERAVHVRLHNTGAGAHQLQHSCC
jgi:hypothetical protein